MTPSGPELQEKDFIHEGPLLRGPFPLWILFVLLTIILALFWGGSHWYEQRLNALLRNSPFLQVTNRDMSIFLWQNPEFMRINAKQKNGYLPGFLYEEKITMDLAQADNYVSAPPELLFRYHTWRRLISREIPLRPISRQEFLNFLSYAEEWQPIYWPAAPKKYKELVESLPFGKQENLLSLSEEELPTTVRLAFQGWKNYFIDRETINQTKPTIGEMQQFLKEFPHYARNFWRNILMEQTPHYLKSLSRSSEEEKNFSLSHEELTGFLRVAFYNYLMNQDSTITNPSE